MPKVSVIIPTYNGAKFLPETIESVLTQTYKDFETIIVDDGSTDNTSEIVSAFPVKYYHQENQGVSVARNRGFRLSCGEYIVFLDSDDVFLEWALEKSVQALDKHPEAGFSYGQAYMMDKNGSVYRVRKSSFLDKSTVVDSQEQTTELLFLQRITTSTVMVRRHCFDEVGGFHEELRNFQDHHLFIRLSKRYHAAYIAEPLIRYRVHPEAQHLKADYKIAEKAWLLIPGEVFDDPESAPHFEFLKSRAYSHSYHRIAGYAYGKDMKLTRYYLRKAIRAYPKILFHSDSTSIIYRYATSLLPNKIWHTMRDFKRYFLNSKTYRE